MIRIAPDHFIETKCLKAVKRGYERTDSRGKIEHAFLVFRIKKLWNILILEIEYQYEIDHDKQSWYFRDEPQSLEYIYAYISKIHLDIIYHYDYSFRCETESTKPI